MTGLEQALFAVGGLVVVVLGVVGAVSNLSRHARAPHRRPDHGDGSDAGGCAGGGCGGGCGSS